MFFIVVNTHDIGTVVVNEYLIDECDNNNSIFPSCFPHGIKKKKEKERKLVPICDISTLGTAGIIC